MWVEIWEEEKKKECPHWFWKHNSVQRWQTWRQLQICYIQCWDGAEQLVYRCGWWFELFFWIHLVRMARKRDCNCGCHLATLSSVKGSRQYHPALYLFTVGKHNLGSCKQIELIWQSTVGRESYTPIEPSQFSLTKFLICFVLQMNNFYNYVFSLILLLLFMF